MSWIYCILRADGWVSSALEAPLHFLLLLIGVARATPAHDVQDVKARVAASVLPAVVSIEVDGHRQLAPPLLDLLGRYGLAVPVSSGPEGDATGSGFIVSPGGRVFTNQHVVGAGESVTLVLADARRVPARVVGADPRSDVAVLQIEADGPWPAIPLGDSDAVRIGDTVLAIGSPFDFRSSVSAGIVSAKGRRELSPHEIQEYLQTDAAVNPGSSGGPLVDLDGRAVGIATAIYAPDVDQNSGVSFAVPIVMARRIADDLDTYGHVRRSRVGIVATTVDALEADPTRGGAEIARVVPEGPAERAGLRPGDVVVAVDGSPVDTASALEAVILARGVGETVALGVLRDGVRIERVLETTAEGWEGVPPDALPAEVVRWADMVLARPGDAPRFSAPPDAAAVVVRVEPGGFAARMGVLPGDVVVDVADTPVQSFTGLGSVAGAGVTVVTLSREGRTFRTLLPVGR